MAKFSIYRLATMLLLGLWMITVYWQAAAQQSSTLQSSTLQSRTLVGGGCEGCELMYVGMPASISNEDTSPGWNEKGQRLMLTGTVYHLDGKTPAANVIVYYWHTDNNGLYSPDSKTPVSARPHGHLRGWVKTDTRGRYTIKTLRPAPYPRENIPAHIHLSIKEPDINEYYADLYFDDDPLYLKHVKKYGKMNRCGTEILRVLVSKDVQIVEHDMILGLNIPNYPARKRIQSRSENGSPPRSGLPVGSDSPSFIPFHAWGPDAGTRACPVCKYGRFQGIEYFVGNRPNWQEIRQWLVFLEQISKKRTTSAPELKVYFVYGNEAEYSADARRQMLAQLGKELGITTIALTFVPSLHDKESEVYLNKINPEAENTFILYKHRTIVETFVNLKPNAANFARIEQALTRTKGQYLHLPTLPHN